MSIQDNEKNKRLRETISQLPAMSTEELRGRAQRWREETLGHFVHGEGRPESEEDDLVDASLTALLEQVAGEGREQARGYATHKTKCKAYPATSEEQILRDCDCGFVKLFGWSSSNKGAVAAALAKQSGSSK